MLEPADSPAARADRLLRDVLGDSQYDRLREVGFIDLPSRQRRGRVYRLDSLGNLAFREAGESGFNTTLCVQPEEPVPRDDQVVMRYLLVTADEQRLIRTANPISFGFISLNRALYHDFRQRYPAPVAALLSVSVVVLFLLSVPLDGWTLTQLIGHRSLLGGVLFLVFLVPAVVGLVLIAAGITEAVRAIRVIRARRRADRG